MQRLVFVNTDSYDRCGDLKDIIRLAVCKRSHSKDNNFFGIEGLIGFANHTGFEYECVNGTDISGPGQEGDIYFLSGVGYKAPFSLSDEDSLDYYLDQYSWVNYTQNVIGICFGAQLLGALKGENILQLAEKRVANSFAIPQKKGGKSKWPKYVVCHRDYIPSTPPGCDPRASRFRDGVLYEAFDPIMNHFLFQYHPEKSFEGWKKLKKTIDYCLREKQEAA